MIQQLGSGWSASMWPKGEDPTPIGILAAFAVDPTAKLFGYRATGEDGTHVRPFRDFQPLNPDYWRFMGDDGALYIFTRFRTPEEDAIYRLWLDNRAHLGEDAEIIGDEFMNAAYASDYDPREPA